MAEENGKKPGLHAAFAKWTMTSCSVINVAMKPHKVNSIDTVFSDFRSATNVEFQK